MQACASGVVSARDAAITLLALTTGLRACDIVGLRMGDIDWRGHTIGIVQQKTGNPLTAAADRRCWLASSPTTCSTNGPARPMITCFLRSVAPHTRLADHASVHRVTAETFRKAGVHRREGRDPAAAPQRRVPAAGAAVPLPTISAVLGHARRGIDQPLHERRPATVCSTASCRSPKACGHERPRLHQRVRGRAGRLPGVQGEHGLLRHLPHLVPEKFDAYCTAHDRTVFDRDTVEGWVSAQLHVRAVTGPGCPTSATSAAG